MSNIIDAELAIHIDGVILDVTDEDIKPKFRILKGIDNAKAQQIRDELRYKGDTKNL